MKQEIVKDLTTQELNDKIVETTDLLGRLKLSHGVSPVENPMKIRETRKAVARLQTELQKRKLAEAAK